MHTQTSFRLLVVRLGAMGDILHALPAVTALRQAHPAWKIGWVVEPRWKNLLAAGVGDLIAAAGSHRGPAMPLVDRLHYAPTKAWGRRPLASQTIQEIKALRNELRAAEYDAVLDLQGSIRSAVVGRMTGCRRRIGESAPREWPARWLFTDRIVTTGAHVIEQDVELAMNVAGDELAFTQPVLPVDSEAETWSDGWLEAVSASGRVRPVAMILPGAGWGAKRWPPERYAAVAQGLADRGFRVVVNAGPDEEPLAAAITADGAASPLNVPLSRLIAFMRRVSLCIGGDTGPLHLACALGKPVVGIYGPTDPARNGPFGTRFRVLRYPGSRRDHTRRDAPDPGLLTITPESVLRAADELLAEKEIG